LGTRQGNSEAPNSDLLRRKGAKKKGERRREILSPLESLDWERRNREVVLSNDLWVANGGNCRNGVNKKTKT